MKKIPKKKRKVTELYFNEYDGTAEIYTYNTKRKKRLTAYAAAYSDLCHLNEDDENGGLCFEIDKHRVSTQAYRLFLAQNTGIAHDAGVHFFSDPLFLSEMLFHPVQRPVPSLLSEC